MRLTRLRELRQRAFLTQVELGERAGMSEATVNRLESGKHDARISTVRKLAAALGVEPSELVRESATDTKAAA
jgi:transcriptional regulator with XRE-family HTH domain